MSGWNEIVRRGLLRATAISALVATVAITALLWRQLVVPPTAPVAPFPAAPLSHLPGPSVFIPSVDEPARLHRSSGRLTTARAVGIPAPSLAPSSAGDAGGTSIPGTTGHAAGSPAPPKHAPRPTPAPRTPAPPARANAAGNAPGHTAVDAAVDTAATPPDNPTASPPDRAPASNPPPVVPPTPPTPPVVTPPTPPSFRR